MKKILTTILAAALAGGVWGGTVTVGGTAYGTFADAITAAKAIGGDITYTIAGEVELTDYTDIAPDPIDSVTIIGATGASTDTVKIIGTYRVRIVTGGTSSGSGKSLTVKDISLVDAVTGKEANAWEGTYFAPTAAQSTFENVTFNEGIIFWSGCNATLKNCTFNPVNNTGNVANHYMVWVEGNSKVTIDGCIFTELCVRGVKCEYEYYGDKVSVPDVTIKDSEFDMPANSKKPAIVLTHADSITLEGNTYPPTGVFELGSGSNGTTVNADIADIACSSSSGGADCGVLVDGKIYTTITAAETAGALESANKVTLYYSPEEANEAEVHLPATTTLEKNGYAAANVTGGLVEPAVNTVVSANEFGALAITGSAAKPAYVAVPFGAFGDGDAPIAAADVVQAAALSDGDKMYVWNGADEDQQKYEVYTVSGGAWTTANKVTVAADGSVTTDSTPAEALPVASGKGVFIERANTAKPIYVYGQVLTNTVAETTFAAGLTLVSAPALKAMGEIDLNTLTWTGVTALESSTVTVKGTEYVTPKWSKIATADYLYYRTPTGATVRCYYCGGKWITENNKTPGKIPAGTAFWYYARTAGAKVVW